MGSIVHGQYCAWAVMYSGYVLGAHQLFLDHCCPYILIMVASNNALRLFSLQQALSISSMTHLWCNFN